MHSRVKSLVDKVGQRIIIRRVTGAYDPATRENTLSTTDFSTKGFAYSYTSKQLAGLSNQNSHYMAVGADNITFAINLNRDKLVISGNEYLIKSVENRKINDKSALLIIGYSDEQ